MEREKTNSIEAISLIIIIMINHLILNFPNNIIFQTGSASIINVVYISIISVLFFLIIYKMMNKFPGKNIIDIAKYLGGEKLKNIISIIFVIYLIFVSSSLIRSFSEIIKIIYFPNANIFTIIFSFVLVSLIINSYGTRTVSKVNLLLMPIILCSVAFIFLTSFKDFQFERIFPVLGYGVKETFLDGLKNLYSFGGILCLFLIPSELEDYKKFKRVGLISIIISALYLLLSISSLLFLFSSLSAGKELLSVYLNTRTIELGKTIQRVDAIFIMIWILAFIAYLSVIILFVKKIIVKNTTIKSTSFMIFLIGIIISCISIIPINTSKISFLQSNILCYFEMFLVFILCPIIMVLANIKKKNLENRRIDNV